MKTKFKKTAQLLFLSFALLITGVVAQAQQQGHRGNPQGPAPLPDNDQIEKMVDDLSTQLSLNESQKKQVSEMYSAHFEKAKVIREDHKALRDAQIKQMDQFRAEFELEIKSVLTEKQQEEFDAYTKKQHYRKGGKGGKGKPCR